MTENFREYDGMKVTNDNEKKGMYFDDVRFRDEICLGTDKRGRWMGGDIRFVAYVNGEAFIDLYMPQKDFIEMGQPEKMEVKTNAEGLMNMSHKRKTADEYQKNEIVYKDGE